MSQAGSSVRCWSSIAQPSVTALSPSRRSSTERSRDVKAKCSVWPASWKSARQSSGPPCGWITSITLSGISIGAQKARGVLVGRSSTSRWTFSWASRSMPRSASVPSRAGSIRSAGNCGSQTGARNRRGTSKRCASARPTPTRSRRSLSPQVSQSLLGRGEHAAALLRELLEPHPELVPIELEVAVRAEIARGAPRLRSPPRAAPG